MQNHTARGVNGGRPLFSIVREDAGLECALVARSSATAVLLVASGGCTALDLVTAFPALSVVAFDHSAAQLDLIRVKIGAIARRDAQAFRQGGLLRDGAFEALFRVLQTALEELAVPGGFQAYFDEPSPAARLAFVESVASKPLFAACFSLAFHDDVLRAMFGPGATQHAVPGSYPAYFRAAFERGLRDPSGADNPFLQHALLGSFLERSEPLYLQSLVRSGPPALVAERIDLVLGTLLDVPRLDRFQVVSLSNVLDWSDDALAQEWAQRLGASLRSGAVVLVRKLNNQRDLGRFFLASFHRDTVTAQQLLETDRSLFYEAIEVFVRR